MTANFHGNEGDVYRHTSCPITIKLISPTAKGWKVLETNTAKKNKKAKTAFYSKYDLSMPWWVRV